MWPKICFFFCCPSLCPPSQYLLMASLCAFSSPISLVVPRTEVKREERGVVPAMGGLMLNVSAEQTLRIFAGGVRG